MMQMLQQVQKEVKSAVFLSFSLKLILKQVEHIFKVHEGTWEGALIFKFLGLHKPGRRMPDAQGF